MIVITGEEKTKALKRILDVGHAFDQPFVRRAVQDELTNLFRPHNETAFI